MHINPDGSVTMSAEEHQQWALVSIGDTSRQRIEMLERSAMLAYEIINHPNQIENYDEACHEWNALIGEQLRQDLVRLASGV